MKKIITITFLLFSIISLHSQNIDSLLNIADRLYYDDDFEDAKKIYDKILILDVINVKALNGKGNCLFKQESDSAKTYYQNAINLDPNYSDSFYNLGLISYYKDRSYENALTSFKDAFKISPDSASYAVLIGMCYEKLQDTENAIFYYDKALETNPKELDAYYYKATLYYNLNELDLALENLKIAIKKRVNKSYFYTLKADIEIQNEHYEQAVIDCNKAIRINNQDVFAYEFRAEAYYMLTNYRKAIKDCEIILAKDSLNFVGIYLASLSYLGQENFKEAEYFVKKGLEINPYSSVFYQLYGTIYFYKRDYAKAKEFFEQSYSLDREDLKTIDYLNSSEILLKTDSTLIYSSNIFVSINIDNIEKMNENVKDKKNKYYYKKLLQRFQKNPEDLSLDEVFMLYYGHSQQKKFSGYTQTSKTDYRKKFAIGEYFDCIEVANDYLSDDPLLIEPYMYIAYSYLYMGNFEKYKEYSYIYNALLLAISMTGDGKTPEKAYIVISIADEYNMMYYLDFHYGGQHLMNIEGHQYDVFDVQDSNKHETNLYFFIDTFFGKFGKKFR